MKKTIFFNEHNGVSNCRGHVYFDFLDYAFSKADYFMLVYVNYYGKGYSKFQKEIKKKLAPFKIKSRTDPYWPGTQGTWAVNTTYKVIFYKTTLEAKEILKCVQGIDGWSRPSSPEDLAFFKGNQCWFYSVGHEGIAAILHATEEDLDFVEANDLGNRRSVEEYDGWYDSFNEDLEKYAEKHKKKTKTINDSVSSSETTE